VPKTKVLFHAALLVILQLDIAQERRPLSPDERALRACLKRRTISLAILERARKKQCARVNNVKEGDANTKFFHLRVNARRRKKPHAPSQAQQWVGDRTHKQGEDHTRPFCLGHGKS
jgi:hypothetical protein